jgi:hypothetical protein
MAAPRRAQHVVLHLPGQDAGVPALVDAADEEALTLVLALSPAAGAGSRDGAAVVEYTTPRGVHRVSGVLRPGEAPEVVRVDRHGPDDVVQRRDFARVDAAVPVSLTVSDPVRGAAHTTSLNVSAGGLLFCDPLGLPAGAVVEIEIGLAPGAAPVHARGRVVREAGEDAKGVRIDLIARDDRERLVRFVTERERLARRIARGG